MKSNLISFDEHACLHALQHHLPAQAALKDFVHHNTLHAFQDLPFHIGLRSASSIFGYKTYLSLDEFREMYHTGKIREDVLDRAIQEQMKTAGNSVKTLGRTLHGSFKTAMLEKNFPEAIAPRIGHLRALWKEKYHVHMDKVIHPFLFRLISAYLDQGIAIWPFPTQADGMLEALRLLDDGEESGLFHSSRARALLKDPDISLTGLLDILVERQSLYDTYLFDQQFAHPGWSGMVATIELNPTTLLDQKAIHLQDFIMLELLMEIDTLDTKFGETWAPLGHMVKSEPKPLFDPVVSSELMDILAVWQEAFEWSYYDDILTGIGQAYHTEPTNHPSFQALFCIDDRSYSLRRYVELTDPHAATYGTPGFFGVEFYFRPENAKSYTKACPAPVNPKYLVEETGRKSEHKSDVNYTRRANLPLQGWLISQTIGFWAAFKLFWNIFKPSLSPATAYSFRHMDKHACITVKADGRVVDGLQVGFTPAEMATRVGNTLKSIGLTADFAPLVYVVGHGASSVNNTHYAGYDCGACCGRPGAVNARAFSEMANDPEVRALLADQGIDIPKVTVFLGAMHDTTRDEIEYYDEEKVLGKDHLALHDEHQDVFKKALLLNARERSRRFDSINTSQPLKKLHKAVEKRSVSLFEPRPELNHATNSLCIIGRASLTRNIFLDRRAFMNSYDYRQDPDGKFLEGILLAAAPVCGGINLEYYFSRVDQEKLGAGTKLPHNVVGLFAVSNGVDGDLRPGLPSQMIEVHDPVRMLFVIEHHPTAVLEILNRNKAVGPWFERGWVQLAVKDVFSGKVYRYYKGGFALYHPLRGKLEVCASLAPVLESQSENLPVFATA